MYNEGVHNFAQWNEQEFAEHPPKIENFPHAPNLHFIKPKQ